ncbi:hypothetical protein M8C13_17910 [Crossiella sp. SN42]|uniref:hypothetical protein n=1 Tax=Crossiella sp. SN42 TaxID=2944808 RepID=UPI00207CA38D|nr:hypothetical protein [Crossiella sp. SN42]MCO1577636.1 hypothetical protein [Crossiella sp. SN42]
MLVRPPRPGTRPVARHATATAVPATAAALSIDPVLSSDPARSTVAALATGPLAIAVARPFATPVLARGSRATGARED